MKGGVVVGVDGSDSSKAALNWAVSQGRATASAVEVVAVVEPPVDWYGMVPQKSDRDNAAEVAGKRLEEIVMEVVGKDPPVEIIMTIGQGNPASALIEASRDAQILVVGNRGHGRFSETLLGSVSLRCVQHATPPVVVVHAVS
ncbi:universal stress protein [[Kitasatospora] papulosa]